MHVREREIVEQCTCVTVTVVCIYECHMFARAGEKLMTHEAQFSTPCRCQHALILGCGQTDLLVYSLVKFGRGMFIHTSTGTQN